MRYLVDTNVLSEPTRPQPSSHILDRLREHRDQICTAAPVWHELLYGVRRLPASKRRQRLETYLLETLAPGLQILAYDSKAAEWHANERARLSLAGKAAPFVDGQIAAIARINSLTLVTHNVDDFVVFEGLAVEDWATAKDGSRQ